MRLKLLALVFACTAMPCRCTADTVRDDARVRLSAGLALLQASQPEKAVRQLQKAVELQPDLAEAHSALGLAYYRLGHPYDGVQEFKAPPDNPPADPRSEKKRELLHKAISECATALQHNPRIAEAYYVMGCSHLSLVKLDEAKADFEKAIAQKPNYGEAIAGLGLMYAVRSLFTGEQADENLAIAKLSEAVRIAPKCPEAHYSLAWAYHQLHGHVDKAIPEYKEAIRLRPLYLAAHDGLASAYDVAGNTQAAIGEYLWALELNDEDGVAHSNLAVIFCVEGRFTEAIEHYGKAQDLGVTVNPGILDAAKAGRRWRHAEGVLRNSIYSL